MKVQSLVLGTLGVSIVTVVLAGCAATKAVAPPVTRDAPAAEPATPPVPDPPPPPDAAPAGEIPLQRGVIPDGWEAQGPFGLGIVFGKVIAEGQVANVAFTILQTDGLVSAKDIINLVIARNANKPNVQLSDITVSSDEQEAGLRIEDRRIGVKRGKAVARCFPAQTPYCVLTSGLWPESADAQCLQDFDTFLEWVRVE